MQKVNIEEIHTPENWICEIVGLMKYYGIKHKELAAELNYTPQWVSMVLNGKADPLDADLRFREGVENLIQKKKRGNAQAFPPTSSR